jgi:hypothetical protein
MKFTGKKSGFEIGMRTVVGKSGATYLVFRERARDVFHVFVEVEAREAATDCGAGNDERNVQAVWSDLWDPPKTGSRRSARSKPSD